MTQKMNPLQALLNLGLATGNAVAQTRGAQQKGGRGGRRRGKPECTPCAATAYVESLRGIARNG